MYYDKRIETVPAPVQHPELEPVQQHCLEAAEYIRRHGWCQGTWYNGRGVCMMEAVRVVTNDPRSGFGTNYDNAENHLRNLLGRCPVGYNDTGGRTKEEVIALLERAATGG